jgi:site-specific recombinase XerD
LSCSLHEATNLFQSGISHRAVPLAQRPQAHPHMLRHAYGFALANKGHDTRALQAYLGHKNIQHTVRYTAIACAEDAPWTR